MVIRSCRRIPTGPHVQRLENGRMTEMRERAGCLGGVEVPSNGKVVYGQTFRVG